MSTNVSVPDLRAPALRILGFRLARPALAASLPPPQARDWNWRRRRTRSHFDHPSPAAWASARTAARSDSTACGVELAAVLPPLGASLPWWRLVVGSVGFALPCGVLGQHAAGIDVAAR